ncbi:hypothetical protein GOBAR_DD12233 [Gossypium barbadense]|nr:hypothetical protein GOBAR_DD12233 [Gossypium barbadense]
MALTSGNKEDDGACSSDGRNTKKDLLLGKTNNSSVGTGGGCGKDFEFMEGDFTRITVNEMPATNFFNQV